MIDGELHGGSPDITLLDIAEIQHAQPDEISFVGNPKYFKYLQSTSAGAVVLPKDYDGDFEPRIQVDNPQLAVKILIDHFRPPAPSEFQGVHESAQIDPAATIGEDVTIGPNTVVGRGAVIGDHCRIDENVSVGEECVLGSEVRLYPNVTLYRNTRLGDRVIIHSGSVIGSDGYGFTFHEGRHQKIRQVGIVRIEDDVEIGSNCSIDRGTIGETVIGKGSKLDNLIQIGHNVKIGKGCLIVSQVGISGSTTLGDYVTVGGQAGLAGHIFVGEKARIGAQSGVTKDVKPEQTVSGYPAIPHREARKREVYLRRIPDIMKRLKTLEDTLGKGESRK